MKKKVFLVLTGILILALACYLVSALMVGGEKDLVQTVNGQIESLFLDPERVEWQKFSYMPEDSVGGYLKSFELDGEKTERLMACLSSVTVKKSFLEGGISEFASLTGLHTTESGDCCTVSVMFCRISETGCIFWCRLGDTPEKIFTTSHRGNIPILRAFLQASRGEIPIL